MKMVTVLLSETVVDTSTKFIGVEQELFELTRNKEMEVYIN